MRVWNDIFLFRFSLFGLPWIVIGAILPFIMGISEEIPASRWVYIFLAFFCARSAGMGLNRLIDCDIDYQNPRTKERALARGDIAKAQVWYIVAASYVLFFFCCYNINACTLYLSPLVAVLLLLYSYTKRVTSLCHFVLASIHCLGPITSFAAVTGTVTMAPVLIGLALFAIISSGDIFYALQDIDFDRAYGLYSIPARIGVLRSVRLAHVLQCISVAILVAFGLYIPLGIPYFAGCAVVFLMYVIAIINKKSVFFMNSYIGLVMMLAFIGEYIWQR